MLKTHTKAIKGMSIAALVLSAISILLSLLCIVIFSFASDLLYTYGNDVMYDLYDHSYNDMFDMSSTHRGYGYDFSPYAYNIDPDDYTYLYPAVFGFLNGLMVFVLVCSVVSLIASIIGLRIEETPNSLKNGFVWFIVGAVISGISIGLPTCVLFILMAVFANSDRKLIEQQYAQPYIGYGEPNIPSPGAQIPYYPQPEQPASPYGQEPYAPNASVTPTAPEPPVEYEPPAPPVEPEQPVANESSVAPEQSVIVVEETTTYIPDAAPKDEATDTSIMNSEGNVAPNVPAEPSNEEPDQGTSDSE